MSDDDDTIIEINNVSLKKELNYDERIKIFEGIVNGYDTPEVHYLKLHFEKILEEYKEIKELKKEIIFLKSHLGKDETEWIIKRDLAIRTNRIPNEPNEFGFPLGFDESKVHNLHTSEKNQNWWYFKYYYNGEYPNGKYWEYDMPVSLYEYLKKLYGFVSGDELLKEMRKKAEQKAKKEIKEIDKISKISEIELLIIRNEDEFEKHIESIGEFPSEYPKLHFAYVFLNENRERTFSRKQFTTKCNISPKTVTRYLNLLLKCDLVVQPTGKRKYKVNIKEI